MFSCPRTISWSKTVSLSLAPLDWLVVGVPTLDERAQAAEIAREIEAGLREARAEGDDETAAERLSRRIHDPPAERPAGLERQRADRPHGRGFWWDRGRQRRQRRLQYGRRERWSRWNSAWRVTSLSKPIRQLTPRCAAWCSMARACFFSSLNRSLSSRSVARRSSGAAKNRQTSSPSDTRRQ